MAAERAGRVVPSHHPLARAESHHGLELYHDSLNLRYRQDPQPLAPATAHKSSRSPSKPCHDFRSYLSRPGDRLLRKLIRILQAAALFSACAAAVPPGPMAAPQAPAPAPAPHPDQGRGARSNAPTGVLLEV